MAEFVLKGTYSGGPHAGQPQYFRFWTVIGPAATPDLAEAERFASAQDAMQSPGFSHWSSFYEPFELTEDGSQHASEPRGDAQRRATPVLNTGEGL